MVLVTSMNAAGGSVIGLGLTALVFAVTAFYAVNKLSRFTETWLKKNEFGHVEVTLYALGIGLVVATLGSFLGLSTAIGAYFAGFALSETDSGKTIKKDVAFLRDFFLVFFFVAFGTTLFYDPALHAVVLPTLNELLFMITVAVGLGLIAIAAHSVSLRVFGQLFGIKNEDASLASILLSPLGEFVVIIATVSVAALTGFEAKLISPLGFMLILFTVILFQPMYNLRKWHQKLFSLLPSIVPKPKEENASVIKAHTKYTRKQVKDFALNSFVVLCFAAMAFLLYADLPKFGVPILYSREITGFIGFVFFSSVPFYKAARALKRIFAEIIRVEKRVDYAKLVTNHSIERHLVKKGKKKSNK